MGKTRKEMECEGKRREVYERVQTNDLQRDEMTVKRGNVRSTARRVGESENALW